MQPARAPLSDDERELTDEEARRYASVFRLYDTDDDGLISREELTSALRSLGHESTQHDVRQLVADAGNETPRGNGGINLETFLRMMRQTKIHNASLHEQLREVFSTLDSEGLGYIKSEDLRHVCRALGEELTEEQCHEMVLEAISNYEGKLYFDGFMKVLIAK